MRISRGICRQGGVVHQRLRVGSKKFVQQGRSQLYARSVLPVREHEKLETCLREAASTGMEPLVCQP